MSLIASSAATRVAASHGLATEDPVVLQETNNIVVWLRPHALIAKVGRWRHSADSLIREHAVATALTADDAPIAPPWQGIPPTRDTETGFMVTLWERIDSDPERVITPSEVGESLRELHEALARYDGDLPDFQVSLDLARAALADDALMKSLPDPDRSLLRDAFDRLREEAGTHGYVERPLHGEAHDRNLLSTPDGLRWIDLEGVCIGPLEWDLAFLPEEAVGVFPEVDIELLGLLRTLNSARVATWCWVRSEFAEMRWHARYHLEQVRRADSSGKIV